MQVPTKRALKLVPGEQLFCGDSSSMILSVACDLHADDVTVKTTETEHHFRLEQRVHVLPRND